jgi:hypothetical protein
MSPFSLGLQWGIWKTLTLVEKISTVWLSTVQQNSATKMFIPNPKFVTCLADKIVEYANNDLRCELQPFKL